MFDFRRTPMQCVWGPQNEAKKNESALKNYSLVVAMGVNLYEKVGDGAVRVKSRSVACTALYITHSATCPLLAAPDDVCPSDLNGEFVREGFSRVCGIASSPTTIFDSDVEVVGMIPKI